jgi:hypothetical protein
MQDGRYLYLGIHENFNDLTVTSVFLEFGDEISVMHSSGSLGTAIFKRSDEGWQLTQPFSWSLYQVTSHSAEDEKERQDFLAVNGWLANLGSMTETSEIEYQIAIPDGPFRIAISYLRPPSFSQPAWWPAGLSDDCLNVKLLQANIAEQLNPPLLLQFAPETWMTFDIPHQSSSAPVDLIVFYSERDGDAEIYTMNPDGSNQRPLTDTDADDYSPSWSPDSRWIVFASGTMSGGFDIFVVNVDGAGLHPLTDAPSWQFEPAWQTW